MNDLVEQLRADAEANDGLEGGTMMVGKVELEAVRDVVDQIRGGKIPAPSKAQAIVICEKTLELAEALHKEEIENAVLRAKILEIESIRRWAFAQDDIAEAEWQRGYDLAKSFVRAMLPSNAGANPASAVGAKSGVAQRSEG